MGPTPTVYAQRNYPNGDRVYLEASAAAMPWKHPFFSGKPMEKFQPARAKLEDYKAVYDAGDDVATVSGRLISDKPAHSAVLIDSRGLNDWYWSQSYAARIAADGRFEIKISKPARADGVFRILFCFENGVVSCDGKRYGFDDRGDIRVKYSFSGGEFRSGK